MIESNKAIDQKPEPSEFDSYYSTYVDRINIPVIAILKSQLVTTTTFFEEKIPEDKRLYAYEEGKWTVQQVLGHIIDTERVMTYRALTFARADQNELPGFEENDYAVSGNFNERSMEDLISEFKAVRYATIALFESFTDEQLERAGVANGNQMTVKALVYVVAGHCIHHEEVVRERYLNETIIS